MGRIIAGFGGVIVIVLFGALIIPFLIDWNGYKAVLESYGQDMTGRQVAIDGNVTLRLLPQPVLRAEKIRIANSQADARQNLLGAEAFEARLSLAQLLRGELGITRMELLRPELELERREDGTGSWRLEAGKDVKFVKPEQVSIDTLYVVDGSVTYRDHARHILRTIRNIDAELHAATLKGPFRLTGDFGPPSGRTDFSISAGELKAGDAIRVKGRLSGSAGEARFGGHLSRTDNGVELKGRISLDGMITAEADAELSEGTASFTKITATAGPKNARTRFTGNLDLAWPKNPVLTGKLFSRRINIDALVEAEDAAAPVKNIIRLASYLPLIPWQGLVADIEMQASGGMLGGEAFSDLNAKVSVNNGVYGIKSLKMMLPGQTRFEFNGTWQGLPDKTALAGRMDLKTDDLRSFLDWNGFGKSLDWKKAPVKFRVASDVALDNGRFELAGANGSFGEGGFRGGFTFDLDGSLWTLQGEAENLDMNRYFNIAGKKSPGSFEWAKLLPEFPASKGEIGLTIENAEFGDVRLEHVNLAARLNSDDLRIHRLEAKMPDGLMAVIRGGIDSLDDSPALKLNIELEAPKLETILKLTGREWGLKSPALVNSPVKSTVRLDSLDSGGLKIGVKGTVGDSRVEAAFVTMGNDFDLSLSNDDAGVLLDQLRIPGSGWGKSRGALNISGKKGNLKNGFSFEASLALGEDEASYSGQLSHDSQDVRLIVSELAIKLHKPDLMLKRFGLEAGGYGPLELKCGLDGKGATWRLHGLSGNAGGRAFSGQGRAEFSGDKPDAELSLETERFDLPLFLQSLFLVREGEKGDGQVWTAAMLNPKNLANFGFELDMKTPHMRIRDEIVLKNARMQMRSGNGSFKLESLSGGLLGGRYLGAGELADDGQGNLQGEFGFLFEEMPIDKLLSGKDKTPFTGKLKLSGEVKAKGRSLASLVSSLSGTGAIAITGAQLLAPDPAAVSYALSSVKLAQKLEAAIKGGAEWMPLSFQMEEKEVQFKNGVIAIEKAPFTVDGKEGALSIFADLAAGKFDSKWSIPLDGGPDIPKLGVIYKGEFSALSGRYDIDALKRHITARLISGEKDDKAPPSGLLKKEITPLPQSGNGPE